jgi:hypothetical protein
LAVRPFRDCPFNRPDRSIKIAVAACVILLSDSSGERIGVIRYLKAVLFGEMAFSRPRRALSQRVTISQTALLC